MRAFYNEIDPYCCAWLSNLMDAGLITPGVICDKPIQELRGEDVKGFIRCHFFAGIAGWELALQIAGWPRDREVWTGSAPCQPFSVAGKGKAQGDERHLWPAWFRLIAEIKPPVVFGEQVAGAIAHGWLDDAFDDLESEGYATGAIIIPACSVGAPHRRDRLWLVSHAGSAGRREGLLRDAGNDGTPVESRTSAIIAESGETSAFMADADQQRSQRRHGGELSECANKLFTGKSSTFLADTMQCSSEQSESQCVRRGFSQTFRTIRSETGWEPEPAVGRVANGIPARASKLRAYGNAIVPAVAAEFIKAYVSIAP